jgi:hypothetical protein
LLAFILIVIPVLHAHFHEQAPESRLSDCRTVVSADKTGTFAHPFGECPICVLLQGGTALLQPSLHKQMEASTERILCSEQCRVSALLCLNSCLSRAPPAM